MTEERLENYRLLKLQCMQLQQEIQELRNQGPQYTSDTVTSAATFPYAKHSVIVSGKDIAGYIKKESRLLKKERALAEKLAEMSDVEKFIETIGDLKTKLICEYRYIKGWGWKKVALYTGYRDESGPRKNIQKFLKNYKISDFSDFSDI